MHEINRRLTDAEWNALTQANSILERLTESHHHTCDCSLCTARMLTDVQDEESRVVRYVPVVDGAN